MIPIFLKGLDLVEDKDSISEYKKDTDVVFVLDSPKPLFEYIDELKLKDSISYKLKICKELKDLDADYEVNGENRHFTTFSQLIEMIDTSSISYVTVNGDLALNKKSNSDEIIKKVRIQLSEIVQQLIYIGVPLDKVQVMTESEKKNLERVRAFESNIDIHQKNVLDSISRIEHSEVASNGEFADTRDTIVNHLSNILGYLSEAKSNELKIAVAASKKSGKSVIVNSLIECELAPTSLELATPNNCIYKDSDEGYTFEFGTEKRKFNSPSAVKEYITPIFKKASMDAENGFAVPDMNIGYISRREGFGSYTIYDTPGPDLAGAVGHKEAASRAINEADVIVFTIDYSKYLTDSEFDYLNEVKDIIEQKQKFYSLIINVNKLDLRYDSSGDKNIARILDYIRLKLISISDRFESVIVFGTSALTYFDSIAAPELPRCKCLLNPSDLSDNLGKCIDDYRDDEDDFEDEDNEDITGCSDEMTILNFLDKMVRSARNFHGIKINNIDELRDYSGMPSFLSYIEYVAREKARTERINNIMFNITREYADISNLFRFQELKEDLLNNKDKLEKARRVLEEFRSDVESIYDDEYPEVRKMVKAGEIESSAIQILGTKTPFYPDEMADWFINERIEKTLDAGIQTEYISKQYLRDRISMRLFMLYNQATLEKIINGITRKIVPEDDVIACINNQISGIDGVIGERLSESIKELWADLSSEHDNIQSDLEGLLNQRKERLVAAVDKCTKALNEECDIEFSLLVPDMDFAFQRTADNIEDISVKIDMTKMRRKISGSIKENIQHAEVKNPGTGIRGFLSKVHLFFRSSEKINRICYDYNHTLQLYDKEIAPEVKMIIESSRIEDSYSKQKNDMEAELKKFIDYVTNEMNTQRCSAMEICANTTSAIDHTSDYENAIEKLNKESRFLENMHDCINDFCEGWKKTIDGNATNENMEGVNEPVLC
ncbi:MAG: dynamin family protein [Oscillospiraceae bacterium]